MRKDEGIIITLYRKLLKKQQQYGRLSFADDGFQHKVHLCILNNFINTY